MKREERGDLTVVCADCELRKDLNTQNEAVISALKERFPEGVPVGVVTAIRSVQGATIGRTLEAIHERRMAGELYEPYDDHLRVT